LIRYCKGTDGVGSFEICGNEGLSSNACVLDVVMLDW
jgi:hypothetical protein